MHDCNHEHPICVLDVMYLLCHYVVVVVVVLVCGGGWGGGVLCDLQYNTLGIKLMTNKHNYV